MLATGTQTLALAASMPSTLELGGKIMYTKIEYSWALQFKGAALGATCFSTFGRSRQHEQR